MDESSQNPPVEYEEPRPLASDPVRPPQSYSPSPGGKGIVLRAFLGLGILIAILLLVWRVVLPFVFPKPEKVSLTYWGLREEEAAVNAVIADFQKEHPNIVITYVKQDPTQYRDRLNVRMDNGTGPDIFQFHNSWIPTVGTRLMPLPEAVMSKKDMEKNYYPTVARDLTRNGVVLGVPLQIDTLALFTNTEILKSAAVGVPGTWNDFVNTARQLTVRDEEGKIKTSGAALGTFDNIERAPDILSLLFIQNGVQPSRLSDEQQKAAEALDFYTAFAKPSENTWDSTLDPSLLAFAKGNLAMFFGYARDIPVIRAQNPSLLFAVNTAPILPGRKMTIASYWVEGVSAKTEHSKEAFEFIKFLSKKETLRRLYEEEAKTNQVGELYPRVDMAEELKGNAVLYPFLVQAPDAFSTPFSSGAQDGGLVDELNTLLGNAVRSVNGSSQSSTAIENLAKEIPGVVVKHTKQVTTR